MRSKSGMTLVEIIVAIAILGIIGVGFMPALLSNFVFLEKTKEITNDTFLAQQSMELAIEAMKDDIVAGKLGQESYSEVSFSDEVTVKYQLVENTFNNVSYTTLVSQTRVPEEEKLNHLSVSATLYDNTYKVFNAYPLSGNNITGKVVNTTSPSWMADINEWYVSNLGYNIPVPQGNTFGDESYDYLEHIDEIDIGNKYPIFPDDYSLIVGANNLKINDMSSYAGRHIIFKSTPASKTGKIGNPMWSNPVYISALTDVTHLLVHLDGAYIDPSNSVVTSISAGKVYLKKWYDLSSIIGNGASGPYPNESASYQGNQPIVNDNPIDASFMGRYVKFDSSSAIRLNAQGTRNKQLFIYAVVRGEPGAQILRFENGNSLSIPADTDPELEEIGNSGEGTENWKIVKTSLKVSNMNNTNNNIIIGNSDIEIAEILIYQSSEISDGVVEYLDNKYKPYNRIYEIDHLYDMEVEVDAGDTYIPPLAVKGKMAYGGDRYVSVKWSNNGAAIDTTNTTSDVIERTITGASIVSEINPTAKQMTLKVKIYPRVSSVTVTPETLELSPNDAPYQLNVTVLPNAARNKSVTWRSQYPSIAEVDSNGLVTPKSEGTTTIIVTSLDSNQTDEIVVQVVEEQPHILKAYLVSDGRHTGNTINKVYVEFDKAIENYDNIYDLNFKLRSGQRTLDLLMASDYWANQNGLILYFENFNKNNEWTLSIEDEKKSITDEAVMYYRIYGKNTADSGTKRFWTVLNDDKIVQYEWLNFQSSQLWAIVDNFNTNKTININNLSPDTYYNFISKIDSANKYLNVNVVDNIEADDGMLVKLKEVSNSNSQRFKIDISSSSNYYYFYTRNKNNGQNWNWKTYVLDIHSNSNSNGSANQMAGTLIRYTKNDPEASNQIFDIEPVIIID